VGGKVAGGGGGKVRQLILKFLTPRTDTSHFRSGTAALSPAPRRPPIHRPILLADTTASRRPRRLSSPGGGRFSSLAPAAPSHLEVFRGMRGRTKVPHGPRRKRCRPPRGALHFFSGAKHGMLSRWLVGEGRLH
jgi:hypothetical protein